MNLQNQSKEKFQRNEFLAVRPPQTGSKGIFNCCFSNPPISSVETPPDLNPNEYDYIVEKLVIKRVPIALFATPQDLYDYRIKKNASPISDSQRGFSIDPPVNSSLFYTSSTAPVSGFPKSSPSKSLRFTRNEAIFDESLLPTTSGYKEEVGRRFRDADILNKFTALHPNLKESERAPKDPCPLNVSKSRRSLAEEISEIAATKENSNSHYDRARNETVTADSAYKAQPGPSNETATREIPTRDKTEQTSSGRSSCFPFGWMTFDSRENHETKDNDNSRNDTDPANHSQGQNYTVAPVQVHYESPNMQSIRKIMKGHQFGVEKKTINQKSLQNRKSRENLNDSSSREKRKISKEKPKFVPEVSKIDTVAAPTIRWKIIIKHHPPEIIPKTSDTAERIDVDSLPILSQTLRDTIEARIQKETQKRN